jgi:hypothetical protein
VLGWIPADRAASIADQLRCLKVNTQADFPATPNLPKDASHAPNLAAGADMSIPAFLEIALLPPPREGEHGGPFPGLYLGASPARLVRPVYNMANRKVEWIGPMEQGEKRGGEGGERERARRFLCVSLLFSNTQRHCIEY